MVKSLCWLQPEADNLKLFAAVFAGDHAKFDFEEPDGVTLGNFVSQLPGLQSLSIFRLSPAAACLRNGDILGLTALSNLQRLDILVEVNSNCATDSSGEIFAPLTKLQALESAKLRCVDKADLTARIIQEDNSSCTIRLPQHLSNLTRLGHLHFSLINQHQLDPPSDAVSMADRVQGLSVLTKLVLGRTADFLPAALSRLQQMRHLHFQAGGNTATKPSAPFGYLIAGQMQECAALIDLKIRVSLSGGVPLWHLPCMSQVEYLCLQVLHGSARCRLAQDRRAFLAHERLQHLRISSSELPVIIDALSQPDICSCGRCSLTLICRRTADQQETI